MERTVITERDVAQMNALRKAETRKYTRDGGVAASVDAAGAPPPPPPQEPDKYKDRLLKYIPAEVIAIYLSLDAILATAVSDPQVPLQELRWAILIVVGIATPLYLWRVAKIRKKKQILIAVGAFVVWALYLGGPFRSLPFYHPVYGALVFPLFTFLIPILEVEQ